MTPTTAYEITCGKCGVLTPSSCQEAYMGEQLCQDCGKIAAAQIAAWNPGGGDWLRNKQRKPHGGDSVRLSRFVPL